MIKMVYAIHKIDSENENESEIDSEKDTMLASIITGVDDLYNRSLLETEGNDSGKA